MALNSVAAEPIADDGALDIGKPSIREPSTETARAAETPRAAMRIRRWFWINRGKFRAAAIGLVALLLFLVAWHLLTKYRVNIYVRFLNVPSPEQVLDRAVFFVAAARAPANVLQRAVATFECGHGRLRQHFDVRLARDAFDEVLRHAVGDVRPAHARLETVLTGAGQRDQKQVAAFHLEAGRRAFEREADREAIDELRRALYISPYLAEAHLWLGIALRKEGRNAEARAAIERSLKINPDRAWAKQQLEKTPRQ